nr:MAG TPA: hypothetical protein [Bacteriophage sp.]
MLLVQQIRNKKVEDIIKILVIEVNYLEQQKKFKRD